jgi:hypothetical protein
VQEFASRHPDYSYVVGMVRFTENKDIQTCQDIVSRFLRIIRSTELEFRGSVEVGYRNRTTHVHYVIYDKGQPVDLEAIRQAWVKAAGARDVQAVVDQDILETADSLIKAIGYVFKSDKNRRVLLLPKGTRLLRTTRGFFGDYSQGELWTARKAKWFKNPEPLEPDWFKDDDSQDSQEGLGSPSGASRSPLAVGTGENSQEGLGSPQGAPVSPQGQGWGMMGDSSPQELLAAPSSPLAVGTEENSQDSPQELLGAPVSRGPLAGYLRDKRERHVQALERAHAPLRAWIRAKKSCEATIILGKNRTTNSIYKHEQVTDKQARVCSRIPP